LSDHTTLELKLFLIDNTGEKRDALELWGEEGTP
jgi:hypothetical protein